MSFPSGTRLGPYEIVSLVGAGGMGEVYRARDPRLARDVAVKVLPEEFLEGEEGRKRFEREARALASLNHPNVAAIHSFEEIPGSSPSSCRHILVMELLEGTTLRDRLDSGPIVQRQVVDYALQIAKGLAAAHEKGIIHRDLKPENLFVSKDGHLKILDFGLARRTDPEKTGDETSAPTESKYTEPGTVVGTVGYMSPEQVRGLPVDHRSDIFSFGAILYELLSGRKAFRRDTPADTMSAILKEEPRELSESGRNISPSLDRVVKHCLEKDRDNRFHSARDIAFALREAGHLSMPVPASGALPQKRTLRPPAWALALVGAVALLVALLVGDVGGLRRRLSRGAAATRIESIAVLPLANLSGDPQQQYFADGMTEELISDLAKVSALRVTSRTSVMRYKGSTKSLPEIAKELGVDAVVEGSVTRSGSQVKITAQLIDAVKDRHLWADSFQRELKDVLALQGEAARAIAREIGVRLTPQERSRLADRKTINPEAYEAYLKGNYHLFRRTAPDARKSLEYFQQAVEKQPDYALAYAGMAEAYETAAGSAQGALSPREAFPRAKAAAMRAVELDSTLAEPHVSLAWSSFVFDRDWATAENQFQRALRLNPNYPTAHQSYAMFLSRMGRFDEALREIRRGQELDPVSLAGNTMMGIVLHLARRDDEAIPWFRRVLAMDPSFLRAHFGLGHALVHKKRHEEAIAEFQKAVELSGGGAAQLGALGYAYALANRRAEALEIAEKLKERSREHYVPPAMVSIIYSGLGDKDQAMSWLERANEERDPWLTGLKVEPMFDSLRSDPRFLDLVHRVGFD